MGGVSRWFPCCGAGNAAAGKPADAYGERKGSGGPGGGPPGGSASPAPVKTEEVNVTVTPESSPHSPTTPVQDSLPKKQSLKFLVSPSSQALLLGTLPQGTPDPLPLCRRSVGLNVFGGGCCDSGFGKVFYQHVLPGIEKTCDAHQYDVELLDLSCESNNDPARAILYDSIGSNWRELVPTATAKRGPHRHFNLIVLGPCDPEQDPLMPPELAVSDFNTLLSLNQATNGDKGTLLQKHYTKVSFGGNDVMRLSANTRNASTRSDVTAAITSLIASPDTPETIREKYTSTMLEHMVSFLLENSSDVRENTCVLFVMHNGTNGNADGHLKVKALANKLRAQLPDASFIECEPASLESTQGSSVAKVLGGMIETFVSSYDRTSFIPAGLPHHLNNEICNHINHLNSLTPHTKHLTGPGIDLETSTPISVFKVANAIERRLLFSQVVNSLVSRFEKDNTIVLFRFEGLTNFSSDLESLKLSLKEQLCYIQGTHPSVSFENDTTLVKLLQELVDYIGADIYLAIDGLSKENLALFMQLVSNDLPTRVRVLLTTSEEIPDNVTSTIVGTEDSESINLDNKILFSSFTDILPANTSEDNALDASYNAILEGFPDFAKLLFGHVSQFPLSASEDDLRKSLTSLNFETSRYSVALRAFVQLLSPFLVPIQSTFGSEYLLVKCAFSRKFASLPTMKVSVESSKPARVIEHVIKAHRAGLEHMQVTKFPSETIGLSNANWDDSENGPLVEMATLIQTLNPRVYMQYLAIQDSSSSASDYALFTSALASSLYELSQSASVTHASRLFTFLDERFSTGTNSEEHPFCKRVYDCLGKSPKVARVTSPPAAATGESAEEDNFRPTVVKQICWLHRDGSRDFLVALMENSKPVKGEPNGRIDVVDTRTLKHVRRILMDAVPLEAKFVDQFTAVVHTQRVLKVIDLNQGVQKVQLKGSLNLDFPVFCVTGEDQVVVLSRNRMYVYGFEISTNKQNFSFKVGEDRFLNSIVASPDGAYIACGDEVQKPMPLLVWDLGQKVLRHDIRISDHEFDMRLARASNQYVAVAVKHLESNLNFVNVYEFSSSYNKYNFHEDASVTALCLTPNSSHLVLGLADCSVVIHHLGATKPTSYLNALHTTPVDTIRYNLDASYVVTATLSSSSPFADRTVNLVSLESGSLLGSFTPRMAISCLEVAPTGRELVYGCHGSPGLVKVTFGGESVTSGSNDVTEVTYGDKEKEGVQMRI